MNYSRILTTSLLCLFPALLSAQNPFGNLDSPANGSTNLAGAINVTGWALSVYTVSTLSIYRSPVPGESGLVYIQNASFIAGSRPDVAAAYPSYPNNNWGFGTQVLTNELPDSNGDGGRGNGTYTLYAIAYDPYGRNATIGQATISVDNRDSPNPFGAIDTPAEGGTASGTYTNFGWALAPQPNQIPTDGSTIWVYVDGQPLGNAAYNNYRSDIAGLFPGLYNSNGAGGFFYIYTGPLFPTNPYNNGLHTISWAVYDSVGHGAGIGSRWFSISAPSGSEPVGSPPVYQPPPVSASPLRPPSPVLSSATNCNDMSGTWTNAGSTYSIDTSGGVLSSDSTWSFCGITTPVTGSRQSDGTWLLNIAEPNGVQACGAYFPPTTATAVPGCTSATVGSQQYGTTTWTRPCPTQYDRQVRHNGRKDHYQPNRTAKGK